VQMLGPALGHRIGELGNAWAAHQVHVHKSDSVTCRANVRFVLKAVKPEPT
jgi:hypothetical protein